MTLTHQKIEPWLKSMKITNYTIRPDGIIDVDGNVDLYNFKVTTLPVQFGNVTGDFYCYHTKITSLAGCPSNVGGGFYCHNTQITSLQGAPSTVGGHFSCNNTKITSLTGIHKQIKHIGRNFYCDRTVTHILGVLLIKGITNIGIDDGGPIDRIMNKYIGTGNVIMAQDELIDAGFIEQAKL